MVFKKLHLITQLTIFLFLLAVNNSFCKETLFIQTIGGDQIYQSKSIKATTDNGYIITGQYGNDQIGSDIAIMKFDNNQKKQWSITANIDFKDWANDIVQTNDGGYIVGGVTCNSTGSSDIIVLKIDKNGLLEWKYSVGGNGSESVYSVKQTSDNGFVLVGHSSSYGTTKYGLLIVKLDKNGNLEWSKITGDDNTENVAKEVQETLDNGYIVVGYTDSYGVGKRNILLLKYDNSGNLEWTKVIDGHKSEWGNYVRQAKDEGFIVIGRTRSYGSEDDDIIILKFDKNGNHEWSKIIDNEKDDEAISITNTLDQQYVIAGNSKSFDQENNYDAFIMQLNENGNIVWSRRIGGTNNDIINSLDQTNTGGIILAGATESFNLTTSNLLIGAPSKAWSFLQGESPCRVRFSQPPVSSVA